MNRVLYMLSRCIKGMSKHVFELLQIKDFQGSLHDYVQDRQHSGIVKALFLVVRSDINSAPSFENC